MDFFADMLRSLVFGVTGGVLVVVGWKIWEARKTSEQAVNENREQGSNECVLQHSTGKQPQEHDDDDSC